MNNESVYFGCCYVLVLLSIIARCWVFLVVTGLFIAPQNETIYLLFHSSLYSSFSEFSLKFG